MTESDLPGAPSFSVFAPVGVPVMIGGWSPGPDGLVGVTVVHDREELRIAVESELLVDGDRRLSALPEIGPWWVEDPTETGSLTLIIDGVGLEFTYAANTEEWFAVARIERVLVSVTGQGAPVGGVTLGEVADAGELSTDAPTIARFRVPPPEQDPLDRSLIAALAARTRLADVAEALAATARPTLFIEAASSSVASRIRGEPDLPPAMEWPAGHNGPMVFIAHIELAELDPTIWPGPAKGRLLVFCAIEPEATEIETGQSGATVLHLPESSALERRPYPSELHEDSRVAAQPIAFRPGLSLPDAGTRLVRGVDLRFGSAGPARDDLWRLARRLEEDPLGHRPSGRMLGWPVLVQDDPLEYLAGLHNGRFGRLVAAASDRRARRRALRRATDCRSNRRSLRPRRGDDRSRLSADLEAADIALK